MGRYGISPQDFISRALVAPGDVSPTKFELGPPDGIRATVELVEQYFIAQGRQFSWVT